MNNPACRGVQTAEQGHRTLCSSKPMPHSLATIVVTVENK